MRFLFLAFVSLFSFFPELLSQEKSERFLSFEYGNDLFTGTDFYHTQAMELSFQFSGNEKSKLSKILFSPRNFEIEKYEIGLKHDVFTPKNYRDTSIQFNDRPFAAFVSAFVSKKSKNYAQKMSFKSSFELGVIGPFAFGKEMQTGIHSMTKNAIPYGWRNQLKNTLLIQTEMAISKQIISLENNLEIDGKSTLNLGTYQTKLGVSLPLKLGLFSPNFEKKGAQDKKFQVKLIFEPMFELIAFDGTLQRGLFNSASTYSLKSSEVKRLLFSTQSSLSLRYKDVEFQLKHFFTSPTFTNGSSFSYASLKIGVYF